MPHAREHFTAPRRHLPCVRRQDPLLGSGAGGRIRVLEPDDDSFPPRGRPGPRPAYGLRLPDEVLRAVHAQTAVRPAPVAAALSRAKEAFPWR